MRVVVHHLEVIRRVAEDVLRLALDDQLRQRPRLTRELQLHLAGVVVVDVHVTARPDELAHLQVALLRQHVGEQCVAGDVEGHAQEHVAASLVQLAGQLAVHDVELEQCVARLQRHVRQVGRVPGRDDDPPRVGVRLEQVDDVADLVDRATITRRPAAPLHAVDGSEVAVLTGELLVVEHVLLEGLQLRLPVGRVDLGDGLASVHQVLAEGPVGPDGHTLLEQRLDAALALQEPEHLLDDQAEGDALGGNEGKSLGQVVADLTPEDATCAGTRAVALDGAVRVDVPQQLFVCGCGHNTPKNKGPV